MTTFPGSPRILKGGIVLLDPDTFTVLPNGVIVLQYNPDTLSRTLKIQGAEEGGDRSEALRLKGPPVETFKLDAEIDATDQLEFPDQNPSTVQNGIFPQLAALETIVYPSSATLQNNFNLSQAGTLEIMPIQAPFTLFVWSARRIVPVRLTDFSITEEAFDPTLNPIRAKVSLGMRTLSIDDLYFTDKGGSLYMVYQQQKESLAKLYQAGTFAALGIQGIP
jgi:Contractile injection system tube protein